MVTLALISQIKGRDPPELLLGRLIRPDYGIRNGATADNNVSFRATRRRTMVVPRTPAVVDVGRQLPTSAEEVSLMDAAKRVASSPWSVLLSRRMKSQFSVEA